MKNIPELELQLNDNSPIARAAALKELRDIMEQGGVRPEPERPVVNMHCHTFFSFNAYGYSPSALAWLARRRGFAAIGTVDFDVLDSAEEFLGACDMLGLRGSVGLETRVYIPEFSTREINSPGEPGITYYMGIGFTSSRPPASAAPVLDGMRRRSAERNRAMVARLNAHLAPVQIDYDRDVLPLTPSGNATERHLLAAYLSAAAKRSADQIAFWAEKLGTPAEQVKAQIGDGPKFQNLVRSKLMKRGGVGYVQPGSGSFPEVEAVNEMIRACGALPCHTWLDGASPGEQAMAELLNLLTGKGAVALNIVPDRNWNIPDAQQRASKVRNLHEVVSLARRFDLPIIVGTEMNSFGQKLVDDFDAPELAPVRQDFLDGAHFICGHTMMQRALGLGYQSAWAAANLPLRRARNAFYTAIGRAAPPGANGLNLLKGLGSDVAPAAVLKRLSVN